MYKEDYDGAMLFVFEEPGRHSFWMKNVRFPLDIIFLNENMEVVDFFGNTPPCEKDPCPLYTPSEDVLFAIEVKSE